MPVFAVALALAASGAVETSEADTKAKFEHAGKCRVHSQLLPMIAKKDPVSQARAQAIYAYWIKTSDDLGLAAGFKREALEWQYLLIPITPDEALIDGCVKEAIDAGVVK